jgi:hypothetical protein
MHTTHVRSSPHACMADIILVILNLALLTGILEMKLAVFISYVESFKMGDYPLSYGHLVCL